MTVVSRFTFPDDDGVPEGFWRRVRDASRRMLMVVFDGALVPFRPDPDEAALAAATRERLRRIAVRGATQLVVFSGRRIADLAPRLDGVPAHLVAEHGWDERTVDGRFLRHALPGEAAIALGRAARAARAHGLGDRIERKRCSITLHTRGLPPERAVEMEALGLELWAVPFQHRGLRLTRIDGGVELRALATHEGTAVARLLETAADETVPVYLGDDRPDEDAFLELTGQGVTIRVGPGARGSLASYALRDTDAVAEFLERWSEVTSLAA
ncbi:MAG: trehalose-phosphatase [Candidatus Eisenbacteria bacterium]|uniref:Trehalose 6-phosphate phosphatase n=1 Tax=Eiseniibacteriota bacterium TaxID=2212470 RepID=A0A9D6L4X1_UNCEI|nr:trehalose-phosphatase [Candidatus Eisenbacteria bacterium]MBI3539892.1 trehalose-phosphatase [Candidatus Eisenbacteria bacterium]